MRACVLLALGFLLVACGGSNPAPPPLCSGASCTCNTGASCGFSPTTCGNGTGSCSLSCSAHTSCAGSCAESCSLDCTGNSTCSVTVGKSSSISCSGNSICQVTCTDSCSVSCSSATCALRCAGDDAAHDIPNGGSCP